MNDWTGRVLRYLEDRRDAGDRRAGALLSRGDAPKDAPKKQAIAGVAFAAKRRQAEERQEELDKVTMHDAVWAWNLTNTGDRFAPAGRCDCGCGYVFRHTGDGECDHWIERSQGGPHTRENGWRLRTECHAEKGANQPDRGAWNLRREAYCERAGIPFIPRRERLR